MPLYGYHCAQCDKNVELLIGFNDTSACPTCGSTSMQRLMSGMAPPGIRSARTKAAREGHLSNFGRSERGTRRRTVEPHCEPT